MPSGKRPQRQGPAGEVGEDRVGDPGVVVDHRRLGDVGVELLVQVGQPQRPAAHRDPRGLCRLVPGGRRSVGLPALDEPVLLVVVAPVRLEEDEPALHPLAVQRHRDLGVRPLLDLVAPGVPDRHGPAAVLAGGDLAVELQVLQRVVLGVHREPGRPGLVGQPARHRPAHEHAVALEAHVVVQAARVVLLHDEALAGGGRPRPLRTAPACAPDPASRCTRRGRACRISTRPRGPGAPRSR